MPIRQPPRAVTTWGALAAVALGAAGLFGAGGASAGQPTDSCGLPIPQFDALSVEEVECLISIDKVLLTEGAIEVGDEVTFRITVTNNGTVGLYSVGVDDEYPSNLLEYDSSSETPVDEDPGLILWQDEGGETFPYLDPEDSVSFTVTFIATDGGTGENCVLAHATAVLEQYEETVEIDSGDVVCARFNIDEPATTIGGGGVPRGLKTSTATAVPAQPTPVSTVAGATAVPPQPTPPVGITLPDTGFGTGSGNSGETDGVLAVTFALVAMTVGAAWTMRRRAAR